MKRTILSSIVICLSFTANATSDTKTLNELSVEMFKGKVYGESAKCFYALEQYKRENANLDNVHIMALTSDTENLRKANLYSLYVEHAKMAADSFYSAWEIDGSKPELSRDELQQRMINSVALDAEKEIDRGMAEYSIKTREWSSNVLSNNTCGSIAVDLRALNTLTNTNTLPF